MIALVSEVAQYQIATKGDKSYKEKFSAHKTHAIIRGLNNTTVSQPICFNKFIKQLGIPDVPSYNSS